MTRSVRFILIALLGGSMAYPTSTTGIPPYPAEDLRTRFKEGPQLIAKMDAISFFQSTTRSEAGRPTGVFKVPVILIDFDDLPADTGRYPPSHYEILLFDRTPGQKSLFDFYQENSYGQFQVEGTVTPWIRSSYPHSGYFVNADRTPNTQDDHGFDTSSGAASGTDHPRNVWGIVKEAVERADPYLDFSEFDNDGDGTIDAVIVVHAGCGAEFQTCQPSEDRIWSHQSALSYYLPNAAPSLWPVVVDGVLADIYTLNPEDGRLGVFCHEFGHTLGLPDFYNTVTLESRVGRFCLMDYGGWSGQPVGSCPSHLSAWCKYVLGWLEPEGIDSSTDPMLKLWRVTLPPIETSETAYRILDNPGGADWSASGSGSGEYFLVENRQHLGYDTDLFSSSGSTGEGLLILHVDESQRDNNGTDRLLVSVKQADGGTTSEIGTGSASDLWTSGREFTPWSRPGSSLYDGGFTGVSVVEIANLGADEIGTTISRGETQVGEDLRIFPNPWVVEETDGPAIISFAGESEGPPAVPHRLTVRVYDLTGALVRCLDDDSESPASGNRAYWDGANEEGKLVAAGVYFLLVDNGSQQATGKIAVVR